MDSEKDTAQNKRKIFRKLVMNTKAINSHSENFFFSFFSGNLSLEGDSKVLFRDEETQNIMDLRNSYSL